MNIGDTVLAAIGGGALTLIGNMGIQWLKGRDSRHQVESEVGVKLEEHRDGFLIELLQVARAEVKQFRDEVQELRPLVAHAAHLDEALDHIHALLSSGTPEERKAAERRAQAFMRRMRGDDARGNERNAAQMKISKGRIIRDAEQG